MTKGSNNVYPNINFALTPHEADSVLSQELVLVYRIESISDREEMLIGGSTIVRPAGLVGHVSCFVFSSLLSGTARLI